MGLVLVKVTILRGNITMSEGNNRPMSFPPSEKIVRVLSLIFTQNILVYVNFFSNNFFVNVIGKYSVFYK